MRFARIDMLVKEQVYFSHKKPSRHVKNGSICSKDAHNIWSVFICVHVCNYFLLAIDRKNVVRTNNTYHMLFQSIQNDNYIGQIRYSKYILRVYRGSAHMGHSLKTHTAMLPFYAIKWKPKNTSVWPICL
jgi:hypothetical protein